MTKDLPDFNKLWNYNDPAGTEATFRELLPLAQQANDVDYSLQLLTQIGRTLTLQKKFNEAHALLDTVAAEMAGDDLVEVRYLLERGRAYNSGKQPEKAVPLFKQAVTLAQQLDEDFYTVDALHMLGIAAPPAERLDWNRQALQYAEQSEQERARGWLGSLYNNIGWTLFDEEQYDQALDYFQKGVTFRKAQGNKETIRIAHWCVAKTLRVMGQVEEALAIQRRLEQENADNPSGFTLEEIGECLYALGREAEARPYFKQAYDRLRQIDWVAEDTERIERLQALS